MLISVTGCTVSSELKDSDKFKEEYEEIWFISIINDDTYRSIYCFCRRRRK